MKLTPREKQIVRLLISGASNKEIAYQLGITERTVKAYNFMMYKKLGITNRTQAALWGQAHPEYL